MVRQSARESPERSWIRQNGATRCGLETHHLNQGNSRDPARCEVIGPNAEGYQLKTKTPMADETLLMFPRLLVVDFLIRLRIIVIYLVLGGYFADVVLQGERLQSGTPRHLGQCTFRNGCGLSIRNWFGSGS